MILFLYHVSAMYMFCQLLQTRLPGYFQSWPTTPSCQRRCATNYQLSTNYTRRPKPRHIPPSSLLPSKPTRIHLHFPYSPTTLGRRSLHLPQRPHVPPNPSPRLRQRTRPARARRSSRQRLERDGHDRKLGRLVCTRASRCVPALSSLTFFCMYVVV